VRPSPNAGRHGSLAGSARFAGERSPRATLPSDLIASGIPWFW
jgi:hypothetical protein